MAPDRADADMKDRPERLRERAVQVAGDQTVDFEAPDALLGRLHRQPERQSLHGAHRRGMGGKPDAVVKDEAVRQRQRLEEVPLRWIEPARDVTQALA